MLTVEEPSILMRYDGSDEDAARGFGLGCRGSIEVFIERLDRMPESLAFIAHCFQNRCAGSLVTVFGVEGCFGLPVGYRCGLTADTIHQRVLAGVERLLLADARRCLNDREPITVTYEIAGARAHALVEPIQSPLPLVIFGAGHDAVPLVRAAKALGWHVTIWDRRGGYARPDRFPEADVVTSGEIGKIPISPETAAVVMTHHYRDDQMLIPLLLKSPAGYVGALGPRSRTERILAEVSVDLSRAQLAKLRAPIGLDIGAEGPEQVALAIVAEILAVFSNRPGAPLRDRVGPIHPHYAARKVMMESGRLSNEVPT
jgi:xanthine/CO dehydrogenase XdhC/CoxF family maturation factor